MAKIYCKLRNISKWTKVILLLAILHNAPRLVDREYFILDFGGSNLKFALIIENETLDFNVERGLVHQTVCHVKFLNWVQTISVDLFFKIIFW